MKNKFSIKKIENQKRRKARQGRKKGGCSLLKKKENSRRKVEQGSFLAAFFLFDASYPLCVDLPFAVNLPSLQGIVISSGCNRSKLASCGRVGAQNYRFSHYVALANAYEKLVERKILNPPRPNAFGAMDGACGAYTTSTYTSSHYQSNYTLTYNLDLL